jgi:hypothetical protein
MSQNLGSTAAFTGCLGSRHHPSNQDLLHLIKRNLILALASIAAFTVRVSSESDTPWPTITASRNPVGRTPFPSRFLAQSHDPGTGRRRTWPSIRACAIAQRLA